MKKEIARKRKHFHTIFLKVNFPERILLLLFRPLSHGEKKMTDSDDNYAPFLGRKKGTKKQHPVLEKRASEREREKRLMFLS